MTKDEALKLALEALETCVCAMQDYQAGIGITEMFDRGERMGRETLVAIRESALVANPAEQCAAAIRAIGDSHE